GVDVKLAYRRDEVESVVSGISISKGAYARERERTGGNDLRDLQRVDIDDVDRLVVAIGEVVLPVDHGSQVEREVRRGGKTGHSDDRRRLVGAGRSAIQIASTAAAEQHRRQ